MKLIVIAATFALACSCQAQTMYRCGNTFSQNPCGPDAKAIATEGVQQPQTRAPVDDAQVDAVKADCSHWLKSVPQWKDPDSLRIVGITRGEDTTYRTVRGKSMLVRPYYARIRAKNGFGAYDGEHSAVCYVDPDDKGVVDLQTFDY